MAKVIIGLGSNLGNRRLNIRQGLKRLAEANVKITRISSHLRTPPAEGVAGGEFLNAAALAETDLEPEILLSLLHSIEEKLGRPRIHQPKETRSLDIDIIYYEDRVIDKPDLQIPHPRRLQRRFVIEPAAEVAPDFCDPILKKRLDVIASQPTGPPKLQRRRARQSHP